MRIMNSKLLITCLNLFLIPLISIILIYVMTMSPRGTVYLSTINGEATILYEYDYEMPYINGTTNEAVIYALGFAHAADRLYDLQFKRAYAYGELSQVRMS